MKKNHFIFLAFLFLLTNCATKKVAPQQRSYTPEVEKEFNEIENDQKRVLNYYRTLRENNWKEYKKGKSWDNRPRRNGIKQVPAPQSQYLKKQPVITEKPPLSPEQKEEVMIEIEQNMTYFCMKNRNSPQFSEENSCQNYTQSILDTCNEKFPIYRDRSPINCVKNKLQ
jgi:hypothetical protein